VITLLGVLNAVLAGDPIRGSAALLQAVGALWCMAFLGMVVTDMLRAVAARPSEEVVRVDRRRLEPQVTVCYVVGALAGVRLVAAHMTTGLTGRTASTTALLGLVFTLAGIAAVELVLRRAAVRQGGRATPPEEGRR